MNSTLSPDSRAATRNQHTDTTRLDTVRLQQQFAKAGGMNDAELLNSRPHLFSGARVFVDQADLDFMAQLIVAIESVLALPAAQPRLLAHAPAIAAHIPAAAGVFFGYDFHLADDGPRLIEINTNAGGGLLNACLRTAQLGHDEGLETTFLAMFREEWQRSRGEAPLTCIAIVDEAPETQYLYPEFRLFQALFATAGITALITDPQNLTLTQGALFCQGRKVDLVYNRLTDFALEAASSAALRAAWLADAVVLTPHPRAHALCADKRNLAALGDVAWLAAIGVDSATQTLLQKGIPQTTEVRPEDAARLWENRRQLFFKPATGYGSKATYRGDELTRCVFEEILQGDYVAQALVPPSQRRVLVDETPVDLKVDLRNYVYRGQVQLLAARLYQGQTTNFRTPGGGFATVLAVA